MGGPIPDRDKMERRSRNSEDGRNTAGQGCKKCGGDAGFKGSFFQKQKSRFLDESLQSNCGRYHGCGRCLSRSPCLRPLSGQTHPRSFKICEWGRGPGDHKTGRSALPPLKKRSATISKNLPVEAYGPKSVALPHASSIRPPTTAGATGGEFFVDFLVDR